jgi:cbb3-type cytochrome oxidase maturation protein
MSVLYLLIPIGLVILVLSIKLLFWAINNGQYDDLDMEAHRILFDDDTALSSKTPDTTDQQSNNEASALPVTSTKLASASNKSELIDENKSASHHE